jgi:protein SCO1
MVCWGRKIASILPIVFLSSFSILFSCKKQADTSLPYYNTPEFYPVFMSDAREIAAKVTHQIGDFSFTNQHNQTVTQKEIEGKVHVANFIFTSCGSICPKMTNHMKIVSDAFRDDKEVLLLSYSVTPWIDNVARLKTYAEENDINSRNWHLLTGNKTKIYDLARRSYFAEEDLGFTKDSTEFLHTEHFVLIDRTKRIRGIYNGTLLLEMEQLIADIKELKRE